MTQMLENLDATAMSFGDHLEELRRRLIFGLLGVAVTTVVSLYFGQSIIAWLQAPLSRAQRMAGLPAMTVGNSVTTGFMIYMKVSLISGLIIGSPWLVYQVWKFVAAGLYPNERRVVLYLWPFSATMTTLAVMFTYYIMLPICLAFLIGFSASYPQAGGISPSLIDRLSQAAVPGGTQMAEPWNQSGDEAADQAAGDAAVPTAGLVPVLAADPAEPVEGQIWINAQQGEMKVHYRGLTRTVTLATGALVSPLIDVERYIGFVTLMMLGVVVAFQLPLVMLVVGWTRVVDPALVVKYRGHGVFACFVAGAVLTPADPISMIVLAFPLWGLFELGIYLMRYSYHKAQPPE